MLGFHSKLISESRLGFYMTFWARMSFAPLEDESYNYTSHTHNSIFFKVLSWVFYLSIIMTLRSKEGRNGFLSSPHRHNRHYISSPRSLFLVHGREETINKTMGVLTWYTDCPYCNTLFAWVSHSKEVGVFCEGRCSLGFHSPACNIRMPRGPHCYSSFLANFYVFPIYLDRLIVSDSVYPGGGYGCHDFFLNLFCHFLWFLVLA